VVAI
jgi:hypothetical protein